MVVREVDCVIVVEGRDDGEEWRNSGRSREEICKKR